MMFSTSFPILYPLGALGLYLMYETEKNTLSKAYRRVDFTQALNTKLNDIYLYILILKCIWNITV